MNQSDDNCSICSIPFIVSSDNTSTIKRQPIINYSHYERSDREYLYKCIPGMFDTLSKGSNGLPEATMHFVINGTQDLLTYQPATSFKQIVLNEKAECAYKSTFRDIDVEDTIEAADREINYRENAKYRVIFGHQAVSYNLHTIYIHSEIHHSKYCIELGSIVIRDSMSEEMEVNAIAVQSNMKAAVELLSTQLDNDWFIRSLSMTSGYLLVMQRYGEENEYK